MGHRQRISLRANMVSLTVLHARSWTGDLTSARCRPLPAQSPRRRQGDATRRATLFQTLDRTCTKRTSAWRQSSVVGRPSGAAAASMSTMRARCCISTACWAMGSGIRPNGVSSRPGSTGSRRNPAGLATSATSNRSACSPWHGSQQGEDSAEPCRALGALTQKLQGSQCKGRITS